MEPEKTQTLSAEELLADAAKRRQIEQDLAKRGMSPQQIQRLLEADSRSFDPKSPPAARPQTPMPSRSVSPATPVAPPPRSDKTTMGDLQRFAADLAAKKAAEQEVQQQARIAAVNLTLPDFRESTVQEKLQAEAILRDAHALRRRERFAEAEAKCREALQRVPKDAVALEMLGDILQGVARTDEALAAYDRARKADPNRRVSEQKYADLLARQQNPDGPDPEAVEKNPWISTTLSLLCPGAGQFYNGDTGKGIFFLLCTAICVLLLAWSPWGFPGSHKGRGISTSLMAIAIVAGILYILAVADANAVGQRLKRGR